MRGVLIRAFGGAPSVETLPDPACPPHGVVVRVEATGLCRSDWHAWQGHDPDIVLPHVPGHELAGTIVEVGPEVAAAASAGGRHGADGGAGRIAVGDRVTVPFVCGCGTCEACRAGDAQVCADQRQPGFTDWGSYATLVAIHRAAYNVVHLPDDVSFESAASLGCRYATSYRAVLAVGGLRAGESLAVFGCGGVGLSAIQIGAAAGARVIAVDVSSAARERALALGAAEAIPFGPEVATAVRELTGGGAHVSLDALGSTATCVASIEALRTRGRHVQVGLLLDTERRPRIPMDRVIAKELAILGSHGMAARDYPGLLARIATRELRPDLLIGRSITLDEAPAALVAMDGPAPVPGITVIRP